jgi:ABC-type dipeptide/oligopeptide/nickel transport system permease component
MPKVNLSHFEAAFVFALFTSIVMGVITKRTDRERFRYAVYCFACFMVAIFGLSWLMYLGHG